MYSEEFEVGGKVKRLRYDFNAIADVEEAAGMGIGKIFSEDIIGLHIIRLLVWAGLKHEDRGLTTQRAGLIIRDMINEGHSVESIMELVMRTLDKSGLFPHEEQENENPTQPEKSGQSPKQ